MKFSPIKTVIGVVLFLSTIWIFRYIDLYFYGCYTVGEVIFKEEGQSPYILHKYTVEGRVYRGSAIYSKAVYKGDFYAVIYSENFPSNSQLINEWKLDTPSSLDSLIGKKADGSLIDLWDM